MDNQKALAHLRKDKILGKVLDKYTISSPKLSANLFRDLLEAIVGQQLSGKAASTIFGRFLTLFPKEQVPKPKDILALLERKKKGLTVPQIAGALRALPD